MVLDSKCGNLASSGGVITVGLLEEKVLTDGATEGYWAALCSFVRVRMLMCV